MSQWGRAPCEQMVRAGLDWTPNGPARSSSARAQRTTQPGIWRLRGEGSTRYSPSTPRTSTRPMRRLRLYRKRSRGHAMTTRIGKRRSRYSSIVRISNKTEGMPLHHPLLCSYRRHICCDTRLYKVGRISDSDGRGMDPGTTLNFSRQGYRVPWHCVVVPASIAQPRGLRKRTTCCRLNSR